MDDTLLHLSLIGSRCKKKKVYHTAYFLFFLLDNIVWISVVYYCFPQLFLVANGTAYNLSGEQKPDVIRALVGGSG